VTLEGWLRPQTNFLDVGFLRKAIDCARSVCRVEVGATRGTGTGVLVSRDLILTNHHVLGRRSDDLRTNATTTVLRFGAYTNSELAPAEGQKIALSGVDPVVFASPVDKHDFVLLRASEEITMAKDVRPATIVTGTPEMGSAMHILQHPKGGAMKLAVSDDGVTWVHPESGKVQYVTRASGGSSGSPCFDANWNVVALHRAEIAKSFGSMREGILLSSIYPNIKAYLT
jgi:hypothetical protein